MREQASTRSDSLRAILFDFDGVLADSEPVHCAMFQKVLEGEGILLSEDEYYEKYLGLDDRACFAAIFKDRGKPFDADKQEELIHKKNEVVLRAISQKLLLLPGIVELIEKISGRYYLAIVSGALKNEILEILRQGGIDRKFHLIVAAEDVTKGKPDPEGFLKAIRLLNRDFVPPAEILLPEECLVVEDSPWGIEAGKKAGAKTVAVLTSYPRERLQEADLIVPNLKVIKWPEIEKLFV